VGLVEKMDIVADAGTLEVESLNHGLVVSEVGERANSLLNFSCFSREMPG
jgi:hypothetical protein